MQLVARAQAGAGKLGCRFPLHDRARGCRRRRNGTGGRGLGREAGRGRSRRDRRRLGTGRRRMPLLGMRPLQDDDQGGQPGRRDPPGARHGRGVDRAALVGARGSSHSRRGDAQLGRPGRGGALRRQGRPLPAGCSAAGRPGAGHGRRHRRGGGAGGRARHGDACDGPAHRGSARRALLDESRRHRGHRAAVIHRRARRRGNRPRARAGVQTFRRRDHRRRSARPSPCRRGAGGRRAARRGPRTRGCVGTHIGKGDAGDAGRLGHRAPPRRWVTRRGRATVGCHGARGRPRRARSRQHRCRSLGPLAAG